MRKKIKNYKHLIQDFLSVNFFGDDGFQNMFVYQLTVIMLGLKKGKGN